jgi:hypothetical protein
MPDITTIATVLSSLKTATDIAKFLRESDFSIERAELKLKLADLISALAETKMELAELQDTISGKEERIAELEEAFQAKDTLVRSGDAMYVKDESGKPIGNALCLRCWETDHKQRSLVTGAAPGLRINVCIACGQKYGGHQTYNIAPSVQA